MPLASESAPSQAGYSQPERILHVIGVMDLAGAETAIMNWYRAIDRTEFQFDFLVHEQRRGDFDDEIEVLGGRIFRLPRFTGINTHAYQVEVRRLLQNHPEWRIIHGHIGSCAAIYLHEANKLGRVSIAHSHSQKLTHYAQRLMFDTISFPTRFIASDFLACSQAAGQARFGRKVISGEHFHVLGNGIPVENYRCTESQHTLAKQHFGWENYTVMGHVGRFEYEKNHAFLIDVFAAFKKRIPNAYLVLVGAGSLEEEVRAKVQNLGLSDSVCFFGKTNDIPAVLKAFDVFAFPSYKEGLPLAALEAQAAGVPTLLSSGISPEALVGTHTTMLDITGAHAAETWAETAAHFASLCLPNRAAEADRLIAAGLSAEASAHWLANHYRKLLNTASDFPK
jgi:glycosyltransferase involved in cell wall biosynthesis